MKRDESWKLADKMRTDLETLLDRIGLIKAQREAAHRIVSVSRRDILRVEATKG
jgi:hypothetical protein